ncbi:hypothetical protein QQP08_014927 [Theobroma cacao]|nr:hypothetical protein QQP08_014927 [Theobroma cacao]
MEPKEGVRMRIERCCKNRPTSNVTKWFPISFAEQSYAINKRTSLTYADASMVFLHKSKY